jgi:hypothetical protein
MHRIKEEMSARSCRHGSWGLVVKEDRAAVQARTGMDDHRQCRVCGIVQSRGGERKVIGCPRTLVHIVQLDARLGDLRALATTPAPPSDYTPLGRRCALTRRITHNDCRQTATAPDGRSNRYLRLSALSNLIQLVQRNASETLRCAC